jgi:hypothetical protein
MSNFLIFLNTNSGAIQGIATITLVLVTAFYAWQTYKTVKAMKEVEEKRNRPRVILYIQQRKDWLNFIDLIIGNYGLDVAQNVQFAFNEDLELWSEGKTLSTIRIIKNGIKSLVPEQTLVIPFLSLLERVDELNKKNIVITVTYKDSVGIRDFSEKFPIDFNSLIEHQIGKPPIYEMSENIKKISAVLEKMERKTK